MLNRAAGFIRAIKITGALPRQDKTPLRNDSSGCVVFHRNGQTYASEVDARGSRAVDSREELLESPSHKLKKWVLGTVTLLRVVGSHP